MRPGLRRACIAALLVAGALPSGAAAAVELTEVSLSPSTAQGGAHPDLELGLAFAESPASDDLKSVRVIFPQGLTANPNAADRCPTQSFQADTCPESSRVGAVTVSAIVTVIPNVLEVPTDSQGDVYNLPPHAGEPARLGVVIRPEPVNSVELPKMFLEAPVSVGADTGYGVATQFDDIPRTSGSFDIRVTELRVAFEAMAARGAFVTNPTNCREATMTVTAASHDAPGDPDTGTASFTPIGCGTLPFAPTLSGSIGGVGQTAPDASPRLSAVVSSPPEQANVRRVTVLLPAAVGIRLPLPTCPAATFAAGGCPRAAQVGAARLDTPLLPLPLLGTATLVETAPGALPQLVVRLRGSGVVIQLAGGVGLAEGRLVNVFDGIPDLPLSRFELTIAGGSGGILRNTESLCSPGAGTAAAGTFLAHSGATRTDGAALELRGCPPPRPRGSARLRFRDGRGTLSARFRAGQGGPALDTVRLELPRALVPSGRRLVNAYARARRLGRRAVRVTGRRLRIDAKDARELTLRWRGLEARGKLPKRLRFAARVTDTAGRVTKLVLRARPAVSRR